ncbi:hypothetical protein E3P91_03192 [Wallemia ichthyophaga]|nr:hypothetical protein E3P91_03192 [Wallemia ichthyophaga]TIB60602.1 hypothetical protein E3P78_03109 [Wallemia ichthyophaga]
MAGRPSKKARIVKTLEANIVYTILPSSHTFMSRTQAIEVEVVQNNFGSFGRCSLRDCLTQACVTSPELLDDYTLHAMNAYESEKISTVEHQPVFAIEGAVKRCLSDQTKLIIGTLEQGDPFEDDGDVLKVVLRFQKNNTPTQYLPKQSTSSSVSNGRGRPRKRAPSTPPSRRVSSSHIKKEKERDSNKDRDRERESHVAKKIEKNQEQCVICGTTDTSAWRFVGEPSSATGRVRACNSCGLYWKKNNSMRPEALWRAEEEKKELNKGTKSRRKISTHSRRDENVNVHTGDGSPVRRSFSVSQSQSSQALTQTQMRHSAHDSYPPKRTKTALSGLGNVLGDLGANKLNKRDNLLKAPPRKEAEPGFKIPTGPYTSPPRKTAYNNEYLQDILNSSPGTMLKHVFSEADVDAKEQDKNSSRYNSVDNLGSFPLQQEHTQNPSPLKLAMSSEAEDDDDDTTVVVGDASARKNSNAATPFDFSKLPPSSPPDSSEFVSPVNGKKNDVVLHLPGFEKSSSTREDEDEIDELASSPPDSAKRSKYGNLDELFQLISKKGNDDSPFIVDSPPEEPYPV